MILGICNSDSSWLEEQYKVCILWSPMIVYRFTEKIEKNPTKYCFYINFHSFLTYKNNKQFNIKSGFFVFYSFFSIYWFGHEIEKLWKKNEKILLLKQVFLMCWQNF